MLYYRTSVWLFFLILTHIHKRYGNAEIKFEFKGVDNTGVICKVSPTSSLRYSFILHLVVKIRPINR
jgi:hypothetical protein